MVREANAIAESALPPQRRGRERRSAIVRATAQLLATRGVGAVSHRAVAAEAKVPLASTTYYFADLDELLDAAGRVLTAEWVANARQVAQDLSKPGETRGTTSTGQAEILVSAILPIGGDPVLRSHYERLVEAGRRPALARAFAESRPELDEALAEVLAGLGLSESANASAESHGNGQPKSRLNPELVLALVDGAAVSALSEGHAVRTAAERVLTDFLSGGAC